MTRLIWFLHIFTYFRDMPNLDFHSSQLCGFWIKTFWQHMWSKKRKWYLNFNYALVDSCAISYSTTLQWNLSILPWLSPSERNNDIWLSMDHILPYAKANVLSGLLASKRTYIEKAEGIRYQPGEWVGEWVGDGQWGWTMGQMWTYVSLGLVSQDV